MIYSEYLSRVDSIPVVLDFTEQVKDIKQILLQSSDVLAITTTSNSYTINLPHPISKLKITKLNVANNCLQIFLHANSTNKTLKDNSSFLNTHLDKWSRQDLKKITNGSNFKFNCLKCSATIIDSSLYKFLDMPSEFWYEFMDYWHCHKPHNDEKYDKTYGELKPPNDSTVLLGDHYLLMNINDSLLFEGNGINCRKCGTSLGIAKPSIKLFKWKLQLLYSNDQGNLTDVYPYQMFIYNLMVDKVNSHAIRKFYLNHQSTTWYFWVTNVGLDITINDKTFKNTLKILYSKEEDSNYSEYELLDLPLEIQAKFIEKIVNRTKELPNELQKVKMGKSTFSVSNFSINDYE